MGIRRWRMAVREGPPDSCLLFAHGGQVVALRTANARAARAAHDGGAWWSEWGRFLLRIWRAGWRSLATSGWRRSNVGMACPLTHRAGCPAGCPPGAGRQGKAEPGPWDGALGLPGLAFLRPEGPVAAIRTGAGGRQGVHSVHSDRVRRQPGWASYSQRVGPRSGSGGAADRPWLTRARRGEPWPAGLSGLDRVYCPMAGSVVDKLL